MGITTDGSWNYTAEEANVTPTDAISGSVSPDMEVWTLDRLTILERLGVGDVTDNSSYGIPEGVVGDSGWDYNITDGGDEFHGVSAQGAALSADGGPLTGDVTLEVAGKVESDEYAKGSFVVTAPPPLGVYVGASAGLDQYNLRFSPSSEGLDYFKENIGLSYNAGRFQYGRIAGEVTDYYGNAVQGEPVIGQGDTATTDENGRYSFLAPGGVTTTLASLEQSAEEQFTAQSGTTLTVDWQFPRLSVRVLNADLNPVENAPVFVNGEVHHTDESGVVELEQAPLGSYEVVAMDEFTKSVNLEQQGIDRVITFGQDETRAGLRLTLYDKTTGEEIAGLPAIEAEGIRSLSNADGVLDLIDTVPREFTVTIGAGDRRYREVEVTADVGSKTVYETDLYVPRRPAITQN